MNEDALKQFIGTDLVQEQDILDTSYFFSDALPSDIVSFKVIDNTGYNSLKAYDETIDSEVDYKIDSRALVDYDFS
jgi:hypothetical protein